MIGFVIAQSSSFSERVLDTYLDLATSSLGIVALVMVIVFAVVALIFDQSRWVWIGLVFYTATLSLARGEQYEQLTPPFSWIGRVGQGLELVFMLMMLICLVKPSLPGSRFRISPTLIFFLLFQIVLASRWFAGGAETRGLAFFAIYVAMFVILGLGLHRWAAAENQPLALAAAMALGCIFVMLAGGGQFLISPHAAFMNGRFAGATGNPQRISAALAIAMPFVLLTATSKFQVRFLRIGAYFTLPVMGLMILASGSRGATATALLCCGLFFRRRIGAGLVVLLISSSCLYLLLSLFRGDAESGMSHLYDLQNSRIAPWTLMVEQFRDNPLIGINSEVGLGESSYLAVAAGFGIVGLIPFLLVIGSMLITLVVLTTHRSSDPMTGEISDTVVAGFGGMLFLWVYEAYAMGLMTDVNVAFYAYMALQGFVRTAKAAAPQELTGPRGFMPVMDVAY